MDEPSEQPQSGSNGPRHARPLGTWLRLVAAAGVAFPVIAVWADVQGLRQTYGPRIYPILAGWIILVLLAVYPYSRNRRWRWAVPSVLAVLLAASVIVAFRVPGAKPVKVEAKADPSALSVQTEYSLQSTLSYDKKTREFTWRVIYGLANQGDHTLVIDRLYPKFPAVEIEGGDETLTLTPTSREESYVRYENITGLQGLESSDNANEKFLHTSAWPLVLAPGATAAVSFREGYTFLYSTGEPFRSMTDDEAVDLEVQYFQLDRIKEGIRPGNYRFPVAVATRDGTWSYEVGFLIMPPGTVINDLSDDEYRQIIDDVEKGAYQGEPVATTTP